MLFKYEKICRKQLKYDCLYIKEFYTKVLKTSIACYFFMPHVFAGLRGVCIGWHDVGNGKNDKRQMHVYFLSFRPLLKLSKQC